MNENEMVRREVLRAMRNPDFMEQILTDAGFERWAVTLIPNNRGVEGADYLTDPWTGEELRVQWDEQIWVRQVKKGEHWKITHVLIVNGIDCCWILFTRDLSGDIVV